MNRLLQYIAHRDAPGAIADFIVIAAGAGFLMEMLERAVLGFA